MTQAELASAGFVVTEAAHARLTAFVQALLDENQHLNLTAVHTPAELWRAHICDSLALLPLIDALAATSVLDLGSGGGLPGIPLACCREAVRITLLDSTQKKVAAMQRIIERVGLPTATAIAGRAETLAHDAAHRERYDAVTARAVAALPALVEWTAGFVRVGGECWLLKSAAGAEAELRSAHQAARVCGLGEPRAVPYRVPGDTADRVILVYPKQHSLPAGLPRAPGSAKKRPL